MITDVARSTTYARANRVQQLLRQSVATGPGSWLAIRTLAPLDRAVLRVTGGKHILSSLISGLPVVFLKTTGARSGQARTNPVLGFQSDDGLVVIASNYGQPKHPGWYHNLRANPECEVTVAGETHHCRAVQAEGERRERLWREGLEHYPGWERYQQRAKNRRIAVFVLEPVSAASA